MIPRLYSIITFILQFIAILSYFYSIALSKNYIHPPSNIYLIFIDIVTIVLYYGPFIATFIYLGYKGQVLKYISFIAFNAIMFMIGTYFMIYKDELWQTNPGSIFPFILVTTGGENNERKDMNMGIYE